jgi:hypothetical protein
VEVAGRGAAPTTEKEEREREEVACKGERKKRETRAHLSIHIIYLSLK